MRLALLAVVLFGGCQVQEFQRVSPIAVVQMREGTLVAHRVLKPNLMLLLDTSGSMLLPVNPAAPQCPANCGTGSAPCPAACATRIAEVKATLDAFLTTSVTSARVGLTTFPTDAVCGAPSSVRVELPSPSFDDDAQAPELEARAQQARAVVQAVSPMGGTPTAEALRFVGALPSLQDENDLRNDFVVLVTDGLPNCNDGHPANLCQPDAALCGAGAAVCAAQREACACTVSSCEGSLCAKGCLDDEGTLAAVEALRQRGIRTVVVGFGADVVSGEASRVLGALANAGGFSQPFSAANGAELSAAFQHIVRDLDTPCAYVLGAIPTPSNALAVLVDGVDVQPGDDTWSYDAQGNKVVFTGPLCARLEASTPATPVALEFRVAKRL